DLSAVMLINIAASFEFQAITIGSKRNVGVNIDGGSDENDDPELRAIRSFILHNFLHGGKSGSDIERDAGTAKRDDSSNIHFRFFHWLIPFNLFVSYIPFFAFSKLIIRNAPARFIPFDSRNLQSMRCQEVDYNSE